MTNTPSEGSSSSGLAGFSTEQRATIQLIVDEALTAQRRQLLAQAPSRGRRIAGRAVPVAAVAGVAAMTDPGQEAVSAIGHAGRDAGVAIGHAGEYVAGEAVDAYNSTIEGAQNLGHEIAQEWNQGVDAAQRLATDVGHDIANQWDNFTGWATEAAAKAWGVTQDTYNAIAEPVGNAAQHVATYAAQFAHDVTHNPSTMAVAGVAVAALATNPKVRETVGKAASAVGRWGVEAGKSIGRGVAGVASGPLESLHNGYLNAKVGFDSIRSNPRVQSALKAVGLGSKATHGAVSEANAITSGEQASLPKAEEVKALLPPGQDPAMSARDNKGAAVSAEQPGQGTGTGTGTQNLGETQRTGAATDPNKGKNGPTQGK
ncbi:hypothetical protein AB0L70_30405 [Kribbella sp. NPDC051952]|uniref:hypothetical protein n=1 Tax=Kribbella sp. NPDC051952 TaxID=3154851 RepID=UPI0034398128